MAQTVSVFTPKQELGKVDYKLSVRKDGKKIGTFYLSKGGIEWYGAKKIKMKTVLTWSELALVMKEKEAKQ